ncbi:indole-3-glycerol-phosphate synthase [Spongiactinospora sp. 9N601]|uniref:indole-3-glycerol-phosphate synthase n=1 Tax=Spongiactinospora sp. 9N601 TaxID=3375149 RepID=UPI0037AD1F98
MRFAEALLAAPTPVIMEIKPRDSAGRDLLAGRTPAELADRYERAGAACLSVVTGRWFGGHPGMLAEVTARTGLPVLQKDLIAGRAAVTRARELGAAAVLLTARVLTAETLAALTEAALTHGLTPFVEIADAAEAAMVVHGERCVVAVNNKDIDRREAGTPDLARSLALLPAALDTGTLCPVSASGIATPGEAADLLAAGYRGLLVGTALLRSANLDGWLTDLRRETTAQGYDAGARRERS